MVTFVDFLPRYQSMLQTCFANDADKVAHEYSCFSMAPFDSQHHDTRQRYRDKARAEKQRMNDRGNKMSSVAMEPLCLL